MRIEAVMVCIGYGDFLAVTASENQHLLDDLVVVTSPDDDETREVCRRYSLRHVLSEDHRRGGPFNKARLIQRGFDQIGARDWVLHLDADIVLPRQFRTLLEMADPDERAIYGADRCNLVGFEAWQRLKRDKGSWDNYSYESYLRFNQEASPDPVVLEIARLCAHRVLPTLPRLGDRPARLPHPLLSVSSRRRGADRRPIRITVGPAVSPALTRGNRAPSGERAVTPRSELAGPDDGPLRSARGDASTRQQRELTPSNPPIRPSRFTSYIRDTSTAEYRMTEATLSTPVNPATPVQATAPMAAPTVSSATATTQQTVTIPLEQIQAFTSMQARLAQLEIEQRSRDQAAQQEQARVMAEKGQVENALRMLRDQSEQQVQAERARLVQVEDRAKRYALDGELSRAWPRATWSPAVRSN